MNSHTGGIPDELPTVSPFVDETKQEEEKKNTIESLIRSQRVNEERKVRQESSFDDPMETYLNYKETEEVERADMEASRMYERCGLAEEWIEEVENEEEEEEEESETEEEEERRLEIDDEIKRITRESTPVEESKSKSRNK
ncbi:hypothetical protein Cantr_01233 [Candida viswanathii]|uniref:Uncharacterized protein n=1 Tax=Candida viswanathii TaxID=5486 RepID=A0A367YI48_9ASCO|nr:hypothetical protein Cantr_01233 [Candida viswanathii]